MSDISYTVFLIKSINCGHCNHFFPIFKEASENKPECGKKIKYISLDVVDDKTLNHPENKEVSMGINYKNYIDTIEVRGYPTILVLVEDDNKIQSQKEIVNRGNTVEEFNKNVESVIKSFESDSKSETIMLGGNRNGNRNGNGNRNYESKYLKYKSKYLELKKNF